MRGLLRDTIVELVDRKVLFMFGAITVIAVLIVAATASVNIRIQVQQNGNMSGGLPGDLVGTALVNGLSILLSVLMFVTVMISAGLIPRMMEKGRAEYYFTKPLSRSAVLMLKASAIFLVYGALMLVCGVIVYGLAAAIHRSFDPGIFYVLLGAVVQLFIWLSITVSVGVLTGSMPMTIASAFLVWVVQSILRHHEVVGKLISSSVWRHVIDGLYYVFPKTSQLSDLWNDLALEHPIETWMPLYSSVLFCLVFLVAALLLFRRKEF